MLHHLFVRVKEPPQVSRRGKLLERTCELIRQSNPAAQQTITIVSLIWGGGCERCGRKTFLSRVHIRSSSRHCPNRLQQKTGPQRWRRNGFWESFRRPSRPQEKVGVNVQWQTAKNSTGRGMWKCSSRDECIGDIIHDNVCVVKGGYMT